MSSEKEKAVNTIYGILSEYFECAVLVGYDVDNERTVINHFNSPIQRDALETLLSRELDSYRGPEEIRILEDPPEEDNAIR